MGQRLVWWWIGIGGVVAGMTIIIGWEFLLEDIVLEWVGVRGRAESLQEKIAYVAMGATATVFIVVGILTLTWSRLAAVKELRQSEERFRLVFQASPGLFAMTRAGDGLHYDVNEQWQKILGYSRQDVVGRTAAEIGIWADADDRRRLMAALANTPSLRNFEARLKAKDGKAVQVLIAVEKVIMEGEERLLIVAQEITEIKKIEDALRTSERQLRKAHGELEVRVQERTRELKEALEQVNEASRAKSDFLANMSHELRTPMNAILGFSDMLAKESLGPMGNPRYRDYAVDIYESGQHLLALINELLDLARIEARTLELHDDVVDMGALIRSAIHMCEGSGKKSGVTARVAAVMSVPRMRGDELRLSQVFLNLIGNALKFTPTGGQVDVRYGTTADGGIEVVITDTGPGIMPEDLERVQTPFARGRQPFVRTKEGLGLGLPLAKAFVVAHGGLFDIVSSPGKGTTVTLRFPADRVIRP